LYYLNNLAVVIIFEFSSSLKRWPFWKSKKMLGIRKTDCLACFTCIFNRFVVKPVVWENGLFSSYFNDLICSPFWLPIVLLATKYAGFRDHDEPPDLLELGFYVLLWSIIFEYVCPSYGKHFNCTIADPWDIVCYAIGAVIAWFFWNFNITDKTQIISQQS
jgi:hypothetical protein